MVPTIIETSIPGCFELLFGVHKDARGTFLKTFEREAFAQLGLDALFVETFVTTSRENVLRGMHLQLPPADHVKLVYCLVGKVQDVLLDLRKGSAAFGRHHVLDLDADRHNGVYIPKGVAHGFCVRRAPAVMMYHVTSEHVPHLDAGVAWDSFDAQWDLTQPLLSQRDSTLPRFEHFDSPFL